MAAAAETGGMAVTAAVVTVVMKKSPQPPDNLAHPAFTSPPSRIPTAPNRVDPPERTFKETNVWIEAYEHEADQRPDDEYYQPAAAGPPKYTAVVELAGHAAH